MPLRHNRVLKATLTTSFVVWVVVFSGISFLKLKVISRCQACRLLEATLLTRTPPFVILWDLLKLLQMLRNSCKSRPHDLSFFFFFFFSRDFYFNFCTETLNVRFPYLRLYADQPVSKRQSCATARMAEKRMANILHGLRRRVLR